MAYFHYLSEAKDDCLLTCFQVLLEEHGLNILEEFSNKAQIFAEARSYNENYHAKVKVLISWSDKNLKQCSVEIRSDEPHLKRDTQCEKLAKELRCLIPPKQGT